MFKWEFLLSFMKLTIQKGVAGGGRTGQLQTQVGMRATQRGTVRQCGDQEGGAPRTRQAVREGWARIGHPSAGQALGRGGHCRDCGGAGSGGNK